MERRVIEQKLESLRRCVQRIQEKMPSTSSLFISDYDAQDIIALNLERAVQQCIDVAAHILSEVDTVGGQSAAGLFQELVIKNILSEKTGAQLARAAGFRNLLVHRYATIDWERVFLSLNGELDVFSMFVKEISESYLQ
jgi:uncharacterized protein YutE (UPF0331/DUF86 family)